MRARVKTVTRRNGWANLKIGEVLNAVEKAQGLRKGEKVKRICQIRVKDVRRERLDRLTADLDYGFAEVIKEGFVEHPQVNGFPSAFVDYYCNANACKPGDTVTRVEFEFIDEVTT